MFELLTIAIFVWLMVKAIGLVLKLTWGTAKVIASILIGLALLVINACYGAGFSVIPAILADHFGMTNISKIHGAVLSAWGFAGLAGNQAAMAVSKAFGGYEEGGHGYGAVVTLLVIVYSLNLVNVLLLKKSSASA